MNLLRSFGPLLVLCVGAMSILGCVQAAPKAPIKVPAQPPVKAPAKVALHPYTRAGAALVQRDVLKDIALELGELTPSQVKLLAANATALKLVRAGFATPYREPQGAKFFDPSPAERFDDFLSLSHLLVLDGQSKAAGGDEAGAVNSFLDSIELGLDLMRGGAVVSYNAGSACEAMGRELLWISLDKLSAPVALAAARRLQELENGRASFAEIMEGEKRLDMADLQSELKSAVAGGDRQSIAEARATLGDFDRFSSAIIAKTRAPYAARRPMPKLSNDTGSAGFLAATYKESTWADGVGDQAQNALLMTALALRAHRATHGVPPDALAELVGDSLPVLPADPFAATGPLRYKRDGKRPQGYLLYSIGPDGKDDGGKAVDKPAYGDARHVVLWNSTGDIVAVVNTKSSYFVLAG